MSKRVLVPISNGFEEIEAISIIDVLRRAGATVTVASITGDKAIKGAHGVNLVTDELFKDVSGKDFDLISLPGGSKNAEDLSNCKELISLLNKQKAEGKLYSAICASPSTVFAKHGLIQNRATCYPGMTLDGKQPDEARVVVDSNCITSRGAGTSIEFALVLVEQLYGSDKKKDLIKAMVVKE